MCYRPTPTLHLNLALTGDCAVLLSPKTHSVWFISILKNGDMGQYPDKSPSPCNTHVIIQIYVLHLSQKCTHTYIHTQKSILNKCHVTLKTGVTMLKIQLCHHRNEVHDKLFTVILNCNIFTILKKNNNYCFTEDWSNDVENSALHHRNYINYILK